MEDSSINLSRDVTFRNIPKQKSQSLTDESNNELAQFKTISFKVPSAKKSRFFLVIVAN